VEFIVRSATSADIPGVVDTIRAVYDEYGFTWDETGYHADLYSLDKYYLDNGHLFAVAEAEGVVVGTIALEFFDVISGTQGELVELQGEFRIAGCDCALNRLYVLPSARRIGIANALTQYVIQSATERNCQAMEIWSDKRFGPAHELYKKFGATVAGERICDDPDVSPEWGLLLILSSH
jgi:GNAT superfamily N-acetyltransferase